MGAVAVPRVRRVHTAHVLKPHVLKPTGRLPDSRPSSLEPTPVTNSSDRRHVLKRLDSPACAPIASAENMTTWAS
jgi:hypothetical protein